MGCQRSGKTLHLSNIFTLELYRNRKRIGIRTGNFSIDRLVCVDAIRAVHIAQRVEETVRHREQGVLQCGVLESTLVVNILTIRSQHIAAKVFIQSALQVGSKTGEEIFTKSCRAGLNRIHIQQQRVCSTMVRRSNQRRVVVSLDLRQLRIQGIPSIFGSLDFR